MVQPNGTDTPRRIEITARDAAAGPDPAERERPIGPERDHRQLPREVSERYGFWPTLHARFRRWVRDSTFERILGQAQARADAASGIYWLVSVDSTIVQIHKRAAEARKGLRNRALGRSRGGLTSRPIWSAMPLAAPSASFSPATGLVH